MMDQYLQLKLILAIGILFSPHTGNSAGWLTALLEGREQVSSKLLSEELQQLEKAREQIGASEFGESLDYLWNLVPFLENGSESYPEELKVTLFRGTEVGRVEEIYGKNPAQRPFFLAKGLLTKKGKLRSDVTAQIVGDSAYHRERNHSSGKDMKNSWLISTSYLPAQTHNSPQTLILRVSPQRALRSQRSSVAVGEGEVFIPFLIHPSEIIAIVDNQPTMDIDGPILTGQFTFFWKNKALRSLSEKAAMRKIQRLAMENDEKSILDFDNELRQLQYQVARDEEESSRTESCFNLLDP